MQNLSYNPLADGERVRLLKCQNCGSKFCGRRDTAMYWLKTSTKEVSRVMRALAEGVSISGTARIFEHGRPSIQRWANLGAAHMSKLHERMFSGLQAVTVQLDEIRTRIKGRAEATWVWVAFEAKSKLRLATHIGERTHNDAHTLIHKLKQTLADDCVPVFSSDGLMLYYGALTGHFGWYVQKPEADTDRSEATVSAATQARRHKKKRGWDWIVDPRLLYGQMVKRYVRRKLHEVTRRMMIGDIAEYIRILRAHGFSGLIQTAYIERQNLQMRMSVSPLIRRTWSLVCSELALARRLELQRGIYHFVKPHGGLRLAMAQPILRAGQRIPQRYQQQTPAMAAGLTNHIWRLEETLLLPLPAPDIPALPPAQEPIIRRKRSKSK